MVNDKKSNLVFLMETKLQQRKMESVCLKLDLTNMFVVECVRKSSSVALFSDSVCDVKIQNFSHLHINVVIHSPGIDVPWKFSSFYGHPEIAKRHESGELLQHLEQFLPEPWVCVVDFNEVVTMEEKQGEFAAKKPNESLSTGVKGMCFI